MSVCVCRRVPSEHGARRAGGRRGAGGRAQAGPHPRRRARRARKRTLQRVPSTYHERAAAREPRLARLSETENVSGSFAGLWLLESIF